MLDITHPIFFPLLSQYVRIVICRAGRARTKEVWNHGKPPTSKNSRPVRKRCPSCMHTLR